MSIRVVSCFGPDTYDLYVKRFLETFVQNWPSEIALTVFYHDCELPADAARFAERVQFANLNELDAEYVEFAERAKTANGMMKDGTYNYRFDAKKFSPKVFATSMLAGQCPEDWLIWLDADTYTHAPVTVDWLADILDPQADVIYLGRKSIYYAETSFIAFNRKRGMARTFLADLRDVYFDGEVFFYVEHHDGFVFERLLYLHKAHNMNAKSITNAKYAGLEAFENSPLVAKMHHLKGNQKVTKAPELKGQSLASKVVINSRYDQLRELVKFYAQGRESFTILETGTWRGIRAMELANAAYEAGAKSVSYYGYDLFEEATEETDRIEFNNKNHNTIEAVGAALSDYAERVKTNGVEFKFKLNRGDTKLTLARAAKDVDFAYLDGGHSKETVAHDYGACKSVPVVVFDDYITTDEQGKTQPIEHQGTNILFDELLKGQKRCIVYPSKDPVKGGGHTHIALICHDDSLVNPPPLGDTAGAWRQLVVTPHDCVEDKTLVTNVETNLKLINRWIEQCRPHTRDMIIVSGGPNVMDDMIAIESRQKAGGYVVAVKHAIPYLRKAGVRPDAIVVLDPRPIEGISTHGEKRVGLFSQWPTETKAWLASMTDPAVTRFLQDKGVDVIGWHAMTQGMAKWEGWPAGSRLISGGTCSAWRAVGIGAVLGFQSFHTYGMDLCYDETKIKLDEKDDEGRPKYLKVSPDQGKTYYYTTGELAAAAQDIQQIMKLAVMTGIEVYMHGEGLGPHIWRNQYADLIRKRMEFSQFA